MPPCLLRPARPEDLEQLAAIDVLCFPPAIAYHAKEIAALLRSPAVFTLVAELARTDQDIAARPIPIVAFAMPVVAFAMLGRPRRNSAVSGELVTIDVLPAYQGRGLGKHLHQALEEVLRRDGGRTIHLHVSVGNAAAIHFYRTLGYRTVNRVENYYPGAGDAQSDAWRMEKRLSE